MEKRGLDKGIDMFELRERLRSSVVVMLGGGCGEITVGR